MLAAVGIPVSSMGRCEDGYKERRWLRICIMKSAAVLKCACLSDYSLMLRVKPRIPVLLQELVSARCCLHDCGAAKKEKRTRKYDVLLAELVEWFAHNNVGCVEVTLALSTLNIYWKHWEDRFEEKSLAYYQLKVSFAYLCLAPRALHRWCTWVGLCGGCFRASVQRSKHGHARGTARN